MLIYALDGSEQLRRHTLQQLERYGDADWVIRDLVRMGCLVPLHSEVMVQAAELRASTRLQTADASHLAAAMHWDFDALLTSDRAFQLAKAPIEVLRLEPEQP